MRMSLRRSAWSSLALLTALLTVVEPGSAEEPATDPDTGRAALEQAYDTAFQNMLRNPGDLDAAFRYAELAIRLENYEAAIAALERMLLFNPDLARARLELGALYYRLGSYDVARSYLVRALDSKDLPEPVRQRVQAYLDEIDEKTARSHFSGTIFFGARFQTNANAGPDSPEVRIFGTSGLLDEEFTEQNDVNLFASSRVVHSYDLGTQWPGERLETTGTGYLTRHAEEHQLDVGFFELSSGPRFALLPEHIDGATIRPFVVANYVRLDDAFYFRTYGAGLETGYQVTDRLNLTGGFTYLDRDFNNTSKRPNNSDRDADEAVFALGAVYALTPTSLVSAVVEARDEEARVGYESNREYRTSLRYTKQYAAPLGLTERPWVTGVSAGYIRTEYDSPDPLVDPTEIREDEEWRFGILTDVGVTEDWSVVLNLERFMVDSNLPNYEYDNWSVTFGAAWRF